MTRSTSQFLIATLAFVLCTVAGTAGAANDVYWSNAKPQRLGKPTATNTGTNPNTQWVKTTGTAMTPTVANGGSFYVAIDNAFIDKYTKLLELTLTGTGAGNFKSHEGWGYSAAGGRNTRAIPWGKSPNAGGVGVFGRRFDKFCPAWEWLKFTNTGATGSFSLTPKITYLQCTPSYRRTGGSVDAEGSFGLTDLYEPQITEMQVFPQTTEVDQGFPATFIAPPHTGNWMSEFVFVDPDGQPRPQGGVRFFTDGAGLLAEEMYSFSFGMLGPADLDYDVFTFDETLIDYVTIAIDARPAITEWRSARSHGAAGALEIVLNSAATGGNVGLDGDSVPELGVMPTVETRNGGIERVEVEFNHAVVLVDPGAFGATDGTSQYVPSSVSLIDSDEVLEILFDPGTIPPESVIRMDIDGMLEHARGDSDCNVLVLNGDTTGSGLVDADDAALIQENLGQPADETNAELDLDLDGFITSSDVTIAQDNDGKTVLDKFPSVPWYEDFDDFDPGTTLHGGSTGWKGWDDDPAFDAPVTDAESRSGTNAVDIKVDSDILREYLNDDAGAWSYSGWQYIPSNFDSGGAGSDAGTYFILLNTYDDGGPYNWSVQMQFDSNDGLCKVLHGDGLNTINVPYVTDRWTKIQVIVDLEDDWTQIYYDDDLVTEYVWTGGVLGTGGGVLDIAAVDLFANGSTSVFYDDLRLEPCAPPAESFEPYDPDSLLHGLGGWKGWDDDPAFDAPVTEEQAHTGDQSVKIGESSDLAREYCTPGGGAWSYSAWQYIPTDFASGSSGGQFDGSFFILLNTYNDGGPYVWATQLQFDSNDGMCKVYHGDSTNTINVPYHTDRWVKIQAIVDLDNDWTQVYYDDSLVAEYEWTGGVYGNGGGVLDIAAVDLFANGSTSVYYDDLQLERIDQETVLPEVFFVVYGTFENGTVEDLHQSDDSDVSIGQRPAISVFLPLIRMEIEGVSATENAAALSVRIETASNALPGHPLQKLSLHDFQTGLWDIVDEREATIADSVVEVPIAGPVDRYLEPGTGRMQMRIDWFDPGNVFSPAWGSTTDQAVWVVTP